MGAEQQLSVRPGMPCEHPLLKAAASGFALFKIRRLMLSEPPRIWYPYSPPSSVDFFLLVLHTIFCSVCQFREHCSVTTAV